MDAGPSDRGPSAVDETARRIRSMQTHSSSVVAVEALEALHEIVARDFPSVEEYVRALERASSALRRADPSHAALQTTQREVVGRVTAAEPETLADARAATEEAIAEIVGTVETAKREAGAHAADLLDDGATVLTHDYSTTVLAAIEAATDAGRSLEVYVTEARPRFLGRKTCRTLAGIAGVTAHLIVDSAAGYYLSGCDRVLVGMDCVVDDTLYNRVGTFSLAATAAECGVPMTALGLDAKLADAGFVFENDFRDPGEVMLEPADGFHVVNPAYDATPVSLLDGIVTESGIQTL